MNANYSTAYQRRRGTTSDYWTSPYVTDPSQLKPRRLTSEVANAIGGPPVAVGCGMAANDNGHGLRIIRVSDGSSWFLPDVSGWDWQRPLAMTCNEVFVRVAISGPIYTMARVAIATLGPGSAPN